MRNHSKLVIRNRVTACLVSVTNVFGVIGYRTIVNGTLRDDDKLYPLPPKPTFCSFDHFRFRFRSDIEFAHLVKWTESTSFIVRCARLDFLLKETRLFQLLESEVCCYILRRPID